MGPEDFPERVLFPGFVASTGALAACLLALGRRAEGAGALTAAERDAVGFYSLLVALALWLSFGPDFGLYRFAYRVIPGWSLLRAPSRFGVLVALGLSTLGGIGAAALLRPRKHPALLAAAISLVACVELAAIPWDARDALPVPMAYRVLATLPPGAVAQFPFFYRPIDFHRHSIYMLYSTAHWHPLVNGYSDYVPDDFKQMVIPVSSFPAWEAFGILRARGVRYVVFHLDLYDYRSREKLLDRIERYREFLRPIVQHGNVWLYEIVKWPE